MYTERVVTRKCPSSVHCGLAAVALPVLRLAERERATHLGRTADSCLGRMFQTGGYKSATKSQKTRREDPCCPEVITNKSRDGHGSVSTLIHECSKTLKADKLPPRD